MSQFKQGRMEQPTPRSPLKSSLTIAATVAAVALGAMLAACTPQDDQAAADGSAVASDSTENTMRSTAGEAVEKARQSNPTASEGTSTDAAAGAAASGSSAAAQSAAETLRDTEAQVNAADEKLNKAREEAKQKIPGTTTD